ncbi:acylphosphatase [Spongiibacter sp. KMU-166]|uniref:acylphosphatase n=1 Tax=Spongiibacter thalassae TaxID=2721624 RepID=A0ABX1GIG6_9GAMM|nr:acylphosphatase [Spongiibacter thalassae]
MKSLHLRITGRVQGVWYRRWTATTARKLGVNGWVRNRSDGSVEAVFSGPEDKVDELLARCWQGPENAHVEHIETHLTEPVLEPGFAQRDTL